MQSIDQIFVGVKEKISTASACFLGVIFKSLSIGFDKNIWQIHLSYTSIVPPDWIASYHDTTDIISLSSFSSGTGVVLLLMFLASI